MHIGTVNMGNNTILEDVLHVPDFHFRLISVYKLCKNLECQVTFSADSCLLQDLFQNKKPILLGKVINKLYTGDSSLSSPMHYFTEINEAHLW